MSAKATVSPAPPRPAHRPTGPWRHPYDRAKRVLDFGAALALLAVSLPLLALVAVLVLVSMGRPVLFRQQRPGCGGRLFTLVKFRTMRPADHRRGLVCDGDRLTRVGRLLRATSLDELPTLWNVVTGDMSLVGPRPLLVEYLTRYTPEQARRHEVRPGVTGLAQIRGRNALSWEQKFAYDLWYVERRSLGLDLRILAETGWWVLRCTGITADGVATAVEYQPVTTRGEPG